MKREHTSSQSYIDWLKALGCIAYCPLGENDLHDYISGLDIELSGYGSCIWNSTEQMYRVTQPSSTGRYWGVLRNGMDNSTFTDNEYSVVCTAKKYSSSGTVDILHHNTSDTSNFVMQPIYGGSGNIANWPSGTVHLARSIGNTLITTYYYQEGNPINIVRNAVLNNYKPQNWSFNPNNKGIFFGFAGITGMRNTSYYLKEIIIFNKELDENTMKLLMGYE